MMRRSSERKERREGTRLMGRIKGRGDRSRETGGQSIGRESHSS